MSDMFINPPLTQTMCYAKLVLWYPRVQSPRDQWVVAFWSPMARAKYCPRRKGESISVFFVEFCCYSLIFVALENTAARFVVLSTPHSGSEVSILFIKLCLFVWSRAMSGEEKDSQLQSFLWNFVAILWFSLLYRIPPHVSLCQVCPTVDQKSIFCSKSCVCLWNFVAILWFLLLYRIQPHILLCQVPWTLIKSKDIPQK